MLSSVIGAGDVEMDKTHSLPRAQQGKMTYEPINHNKERYIDVKHTVGHLKRLWLNMGGSVQGKPPRGGDV